MTVRITTVLFVLMYCVLALVSAQRRVEMNALPLPQSYVSEGSNEGEKSPLLAGVFSLILPGAGEWYVGDLSGGQYHLIAEGGLWLTYGGMRAYSKWLKDDAQSYAMEYAGAQFGGKDEDFDVNVGDYISRDEYNQAMLRNRAYDAVYASAEYTWEWQTDQQRSTFRGMRVRSDRFRSDAKFAIAGLVINRLVSAFSAARLARRHNANLSGTGSVDIGINAMAGVTSADGIQLQLRATF